MPAKRKPKSLKLVEGTYQPEHDVGAEARTRRAASERPPSHLSVETRKAWRELMSKAPLGAWRDADEVLVEVAAETLSDYRSILAAARRESMVQSTSGGTRIHALRTEARRLAASLQKLLIDLAMTPASRSRVIVADPSGDLPPGWKNPLRG